MIDKSQRDRQADGMKEAGTKRNAEKKKSNPISSKALEGDVPISAGKLIVLKRKELGWSQEQLAWNCGLSRVQIGRIERDECDPGIKTIEELEAVLGIELYDLFMGQKRNRTKMLKNRQRGLHTYSDLFEQFEKELVRKGLSQEELKEVLDRALKIADTGVEK